MHSKTRGDWPFSGLFFDFRVILTCGGYLPKLASKDSQTQGIAPGKGAEILRKVRGNFAEYFLQ